MCFGRFFVTFVATLVVTTSIAAGTGVRRQIRLAGPAGAFPNGKSSTAAPADGPSTMPSGWLFPTASPTLSTGGYCGFLCYNAAFGGWHLAQDIINPLGAPVFAIADGEVVRSSSSVGSYGPNGTVGGAVVVRHRATDGTDFVALYGHLDSPHPLGPVCAGEILGISNNWDPPHVHFGVHPGYEVPARAYRGYTYVRDRTYGWTDPFPFLAAHPRVPGGSSVTFRPGGAAPLHPNGTLVRRSSDPTVYLLEGGLRRGIVSASVLASLYTNGGFCPDDSIVVADDELARYPAGPVVSSTLGSNGRSQPDGRLIKAPGGAEVSIVTDGGFRRPFATGEVFLGLGYSFCRVRETYDYYAYPVGPIVTGQGASDGPGDSSTTMLSSGQPVSGSVETGAWLYFAVDVPGGSSQLQVTMSGASDPDLYVRFGTRPTLDSWDCRPYVDGPDEQCLFTYPTPGTWYIGVHGYAGSPAAFTLTATVGGTSPWSTILQEGAESGAPGWTTSSNIAGNYWVIQAAEPHSGTYRFSTGNGVNALDNMDQSMWSPTFDLGGRSEARLSYFVCYDLESGYDTFRVEISTDGGATFQELSRASGMSPGTNVSDHLWAPEVTVDLAPWAGHHDTVLRFRMVTDASVRSWGVVLDDLRVETR